MHPCIKGIKIWHRTSRCTNFGKKGLGILFILGAALCFALMNLFVNMAGDLPLFQKVFFRNGLTVIVVGAMLCFQKERFRIRSKACIPWHFLRSALGLLGVILNFYAIDHIGSISDASILNKLSPFFAILFSVFLLREKPRNPEIIFVLIAFAGAMCVVNPRFDMEVIPAPCGLCEQRLRRLRLHLRAYSWNEGRARHYDGILLCGVLHRYNAPRDDRDLRADDGHAAFIPPARGSSRHGRTVLHHRAIWE